MTMNMYNKLSYVSKLNKAGQTSGQLVSVQAVVGAKVENMAPVSKLLKSMNLPAMILSCSCAANGERVETGSGLIQREQKGHQMPEKVDYPVKVEVACILYLVQE